MHLVSFNHRFHIYFRQILHRVDTFHAVGGMCKDSGVSVMAKSLFASLPQHMNKASIFEVQNDVSSTDNHLNFHKLRNMRGTFPESSSAFSYQNHKRANIGWNIF